MTTRPDFIDMARTWLVRAQGHSRPELERSLAAEMEAAWELGVANAIEAVAAEGKAAWMASPGALAEYEHVEHVLRTLLDKPTDPRGN